jgi:hypothetical protein
MSIAFSPSRRQGMKIEDQVECGNQLELKDSLKNIQADCDLTNVQSCINNQVKN